MKANRTFSKTVSLTVRYCGLLLLSLALTQSSARAITEGIWDYNTSSFTTTRTDADSINDPARAVDLVTEMATDSQGRVYIVYTRSNGVTNRLYLSRYDGTSPKVWDQDTLSFTDTLTDADPIDNGTNNIVSSFGPQIAVDSADRVYILFTQSDGSQNRLYLVRFDGSSIQIWDNDTSSFTSTLTDGDPIDAATGQQLNFFSPPDLKIDSNDNVYYAFTQPDGVVGERMYMGRYDGTSVKIWDNDTSSFTSTFSSADPVDAATGSAVVTFRTFLTIDSADRVYLTVAQVNGSFVRMYLTRFDGTDVQIWDNDTSSFTDTFGNADPIDNGLASHLQYIWEPKVDSSDNLYLAFSKSNGSNDRLYLTRFDGTSPKIWDNDTSSFTTTFTNGDPIDNGSATNLLSQLSPVVIDSSDRVYIVFNQGFALYLTRFDGTDVGIWDSGTSTFTTTFANADPISVPAIGNVGSAQTIVPVLDGNDRIHIAFGQMASSITRIYLTSYDAVNNQVEIWDVGTSAFTTTLSNADALDNASGNSAGQQVQAVYSADTNAVFFAYEQKQGLQTAAFLNRVQLDEEIDVRGNGKSIVNGDSTPTNRDHTDFGLANVATETVSRTFTVKNTGTGTINLTGMPRVVVGGTHAADFTVSAQPSSPIAASSTTTFQVQFDPSATGLRMATVSIANDDANENPYTFSIQGTGSSGPEIDIKGNAVSIASGDVTPSTADHTDFGSLSTAVGTVSRTFTISNTGDTPLNLSGSPRVVLSGTNAAEFTVTTQPSTPVATGGSTTTFAIEFDPAAVGVRTASISISNDDTNENPYTFSIQGTGLLDTDADGDPDVTDPDDDNDGVSDTQEMADGTNPLDPGSYIPVLPTTFCSEWNGYLGMENVNEYANAAIASRNLDITLNDSDGNAQSMTGTSVQASSQRDVLVHGLLGFTADAYGRTCTTVTDGVSGDIDGRTIWYHPDGAGYDFAIALPYYGGKVGSQFMPLNTYHPNLVVSNLVANWVMVVNDSMSAESGVVYYYAQDGSLLGSEAATLVAGGRRDFAAHQFGPNIVGLIEWRPDNFTSKWVVRNIRYYYDNTSWFPSFNTAMQIEGTKPTGEVISVPLDKRNGTAVLELSNATASSITVAATFRNVNGSVALTTSYTLGAYSTIHVVADSILATDVGAVTLDGSAPGSVVAVGVHYTRDTALELVNAYALFSREAKGSVLRSSYNTFLGQTCDLLLVNATSSAVTSSLTMTRYDGTVVASGVMINTPANGVTNYDLCANDAADNYGSVVVQPTIADSVSGGVIRHGLNKRYSFATELRP